MGTGIENYMRTYRKRSGLSTRDLAFLLGLRSSQIISRYEDSNRLPSVKILLAASVLFNAPPGDLLPGVVREVETLLVTRAKTFTDIHKHNDNPLIQHKLDFLLDAMSRLEVRDN